jgi:hypothetical protein
MLDTDVPRVVVANGLDLNLLRDRALSGCGRSARCSRERFRRRKANVTQVAARGIMDGFGAQGCRLTAATAATAAKLRSEG